MALAPLEIPEATIPNISASVSSRLSRRMSGQAQALGAGLASRLLSRTPVLGDRCPEPKELLIEEMRRSMEPLLSTVARALLTGVSAVCRNGGQGAELGVLKALFSQHGRLGQQVWPGQAAEVGMKQMQSRQTRGQPQAGGQELGWACCQGS